MSYNKTTGVQLMKKLSVFLLLLGLVGCKYPSKLEAEKACEAWGKDGDVGYCREEEETKQILGLTYDGKKGQSWSEWKGVKHFRY